MNMPGSTGMRTVWFPIFGVRYMQSIDDSNALLINLEQRLTALERDCSLQRRSIGRWRLLSAALAATIVGGATLAAMSPRDEVADIIQARRFEVVDGQNRLVFAASASERGGQIDLWDVNGRNTLRLSNNDHGGDLALWSRRGFNVIGAFATNDGGEIALWNSNGSRVLRQFGAGDGGRIEVHDDQDRTQVTLSTSEAGGSLAALNIEGTKVFEAGTNVEGAGTLTLHRNGAAQPPVFVTAAVAGGRIDLRNASGSTVMSSSIDERGAGSLALGNPQGAPMVSISSSPDGGLFTIAGDVGTPIFTVASVKDNGGAMSISNAAGRQVFIVGAKPQGGLLSLMNATGNKVMTAGLADDMRGGAVTIRNGRGVQVFAAGTGQGEDGAITITDADGHKPHTILPGMSNK